MTLSVSGFGVRARRRTPSGQAFRLVAFAIRRSRSPPVSRTADGLLRRSRSPPLSLGGSAFRDRRGLREDGRVTPCVIMVSRDAEHRFSKQPVDVIALLAGVGVAGDAH